MNVTCNVVARLTCIVVARLTCRRLELIAVREGMALGAGRRYTFQKSHGIFPTAHLQQNPLLLKIWADRTTVERVVADHCKMHRRRDGSVTCRASIRDAARSSCFWHRVSMISLRLLRHPAELVARYAHSQGPVHYRGLLLQRC